MLNTIIVLLASFIGTGLIIRLIREFIAIGKRKEKDEKNFGNNSNAGRK